MHTWLAVFLKEDWNGILQIEEYKYYILHNFP